MEGRPLELEPLTEEEREWLMDGLATLIRRRGFEPFVASRILRATNEDFPDAVPKGPPGARVLMRRLLRYAGMPEHRVHLQIYSERAFSELDQHGMGHAGPGTAAWFAGIEGDVCHFGVNARELGDQGELIGTLGHEVAHAYRHLHDLRVRDSEVEECLTDLTAVYLGFGTFLLNSSAVFKTGGYSDSGDRYLYQTQERGYLSPRQIALLLAAQVVVRDLDRKGRGAVASELAPNHRKLFEDACALLPAPSELRKRLGVPEPSSWPTADSAAVVVDALAPEDEDEDEVQPIIDEPTPPGSTARRIESTHAGLFAMSGALLCIGLGAFGVLEGWPLLGGLFIAATLGFLVGKRLARRGSR